MNELNKTKRTANYITQVKSSFIFRATAIICTYISFPLMVNYLGAEKYGVLSTALAIFSWISFIDLGITKGLRNKIATLLAEEKIKYVPSYLYVSYYTLTIISVVALSIIIPVVWNVQWNVILNISDDLVHSKEVAATFVILAVGLFVGFILSVLYAIFGALQKTSWIAFLQALGSVFTLIGLLVNSPDGKWGLIDIAWLVAFSTVAPLFFMTLYFYSYNKELKPRGTFSCAKVYPLMEIGLKFLIIQLAYLILFATDKIIISYYLGPGYVTEYDAIYKLFSIFLLVHGTISSPLWSTYTEAHVLKDFIWIKNMLKKQIKIIFYLSVCVVVMTFLAGPIIKIWISDKVDVSFGVVLLMAIFILLSMWNNIFSMYLNGVGKLKAQMYTSVFVIFSNIPLSIMLVGKFDLGMEGVLFATIIAMMMPAVVLPMQTMLNLREK